MTTGRTKSHEDRIVSAVKALFGAPGSRQDNRTRLLNSWVGPNAEVFVVYADDVADLVFGRRYVAGDLRKAFGPDTAPEVVASFIVADDVLEPSGPGTTIDVPWAHGRVEKPEMIRWIGEPRPSKCEH